MKGAPSPQRRGACGSRFARVTALWCTLAACSIADSERIRLIDETLRERAGHLASVDRGEIARGLIRAEKRTGVDALLLLALMEEESRFKPRARRRRGALGLLQVRPATGRAVAERNDIPWKGESSLFEPTLNVLIGATYLAELRERFGSWDLALTAYHQGPTRARRLADRGKQPTSRYAGRVLRRFESLRQTAAAVAPSARPE